MGMCQELPHQDQHHNQVLQGAGEGLILAHTLASQVHSSSPEYNKSCVCNVCTKKFTRKVDKTSVSRPPSEPSRFLISTTNNKS
ncbi:unnamed protein product [Bathycoccus prasinos]